MSKLNDKLELVQAQLDALYEEVESLLKAAPTTDEYLQDELTWIRGLDRYLLVRPDGRRYSFIPTRSYTQSTFQQRPAALRAARDQPGCRIYDAREARFLTAEELKA